MCLTLVGWFDHRRHWYRFADNAQMSVLNLSLVYSVVHKSMLYMFWENSYLVFMSCNLFFALQGVNQKLVEGRREGLDEHVGVGMDGVQRRKYSLLTARQDTSCMTWKLDHHAASLLTSRRWYGWCKHSLLTARVDLSKPLIFWPRGIWKHFAPGWA